MMLDEIDKMGRGIQGDPVRGDAGGARPRAEQHVPRQLSRRAVRPVAAWCSSPPPTCSTPFPGRCATAWRSSASPATPRTRSCEIARRYLVRAPARGERPDGRSRSRSTTRRCARSSSGYTREAGVRNLEREIGKVLRHAAVRIAEGERGRGRASTQATSPPSSGRRASRTRSRCAPACPASRPGSPGRRSAATSCSSRRRATPGSGRLILTGQLGDVMRESAQAALSLVKNRAAAARHRSGAVREERHPRPRAGRRHAEGRAERRRRDVHGAGLAADRPHRAQRHGDDRRDQPARPGAAGRRHQGEGGRGRARPA